MELEKPKMKLVIDQEVEDPSLTVNANSNTNITGKQPSRHPLDLYQVLNQDEVGDAFLYASLHRNRFRFDKASGRWYEWKAHFWLEDRLDEVTAAIDKVSKLYESQAKIIAMDRNKASLTGRQDRANVLEKEEKAFVKRARQLRTAYRKRNVLSLAAVGQGSLAITGDEWDRHPLLLGCANGIIDLQTGILLGGRREWYIKTVAPTTWTGIGTSAPLWESFLYDVFTGDADLIDYVQRLFGYAITARNSEHILPILHGSGRNGKGTLTETVGHVLGPLAGPVQAEMLLDQGRVRSSAGPSPDIMALRGKRLVWASEPKEDGRLDAGKVKWLTGGDTLVGREPYGRHEVAFQPSHTLFLLTNHKPKANPRDYALWNRIHLIPFSRSFIDTPKESWERKRDPSLPEKLKAESSGVLAWMVRGCLEWLQKGLDPPDIVVQATARYRSEEDEIRQFLQDCCVVDPQAEVNVTDLYKSYKQWSEGEGVPPAGRNTFARRVREGFKEIHKGKGNHFVGLGLRETAEEEE